MLKFRLLTAAVLAAGLTLAGGPAWADDDRNERKEHHGHTDRDRGRDSARAQSGVTVNVNVQIGERERVVIHEYYVEEIRGGRCPPGLAKKHNGCLPPGQAKKWAKGRPLPREVIFHELPPALVIKIGAPPPGYRYVRVANDILMIALGSGMVVDALADLGRL